MRTFLKFAMMMFLGFFGLVLLFGDRESMWLLILSKPIGILMLCASYALNEDVKNDIRAERERYDTKSNNHLN